MESEKRKRNGDENKNKEKKNSVKVSRKEEETTEEEVEEFFTILRRMQVAVKYFGEGWRTVVESEAAAVVVDGDHNEIEEVGEDDIDGNDDHKEEITKKEKMSIHGVFDLNSEPDQEER